MIFFPKVDTMTLIQAKALTPFQDKLIKSLNARLGIEFILNHGKSFNTNVRISMH